MAGWVIFCAFCSSAGWVLSALKALNPIGYLVALGLFSGVGVFWWLRSGRRELAWPRPAPLRKRFRKPLPLAFMLLTTLVFLGGAIHPPINYDALAYRLPRVLHWLAADQWHWIVTDFQRLNVRACGFEWVAAFFIAITQTDRFLFLINIVSFLLLPGLCFSVLRRLGVSDRVAWTWMWVLPTGYCFLLQAGSIANDLFGATFALCALHFALKARESGRPRDLWLSLLAAALLTGSKASNLPLLLPWALAVWPSVRLIWRSPVATMVVIVAAGLSSFAPTAIMNVRHCGDWTGQAAEPVSLSGDPFFRLGVNTILLLTQNLAPPVFPVTGAWDNLVQRTLPLETRETLKESFEPAGSRLALPEMQTEEAAGLGFGVTFLMMVSILTALSVNRGHSPQKKRLNVWIWVLILSPWVALLVFMAKSGMSGISRLIAPYYILCLAGPLCIPGMRQVIRRGWWQLCAAVVFLMAASLVILSPARPLWPAGVVIAAIKNAGYSHRLLDRVEEVYSVQASRADAFAPVIPLLPEGTAILGMVTFDDPEAALWRPYGSREIKHVRQSDSAETLKGRGIRVVLISTETFESRFETPLEQWLQRNNAAVLEKIPLKLRGGRGPIDWLLVELGAGPLGSPSSASTSP